MRVTEAVQDGDLEYLEDPTETIEGMALGLAPASIPLSTTMCVTAFEQVPTAFSPVRDPQVVLGNHHGWAGFTPIPNLFYASDTHYPWNAESDAVRETDRLRIRDGCLELSDAPRLGVSIDEDRLARSRSSGAGLDWIDETDAALAQKVEWIQQSAPDRFDELELATLIWAVEIADSRQAGAERIAARMQRPVEQILQSPYYLIGSVDGIVEKLLEQRERHHISHVSIFEWDTAAFAPVVARLAGKVDSLLAVRARRSW